MCNSRFNLPNGVFQSHCTVARKEMFALVSAHRLSLFHGVLNAEPSDGVRTANPKIWPSFSSLSLRPDISSTKMASMGLASGYSERELPREFLRLRIGHSNTAIDSRTDSQRLVQF